MALVYPQELDLAFKELVQYEEKMAEGSSRSESYTAAVPGLLQTEAYAETVLHVWGNRGDRLRQLVDFRLARQDLMLERVQMGAHYDFLVPEPVLRRLVGRPQAMAAQMRLLEQMSETRGISIRIFPLSSGVFEGCDTAFTIIELAERYGIVHIEGEPEYRNYREPAQVLRFRTMYETALGRALSQTDSLDMIVRQAEAWEAA